MSENGSGSAETLFVLLLGAAAGAAAGLLLAPRRGRETRARLKRWLDDVEQDLRDEGLDDVIDKGKAAVREQAAAARDKVEAVVREKADAVKGKVSEVIREAWQGRER